ncbi:MAG: hypothetical protein NTW67_05820 [Candidatus Woesearchaeota archaeon]|nr:hypothetical protein [Candidatus Woesearchaeota archaeon]
MAKKTGYGIYIVVGIVIIFVAALVYYSGGNVGQAVFNENQKITCYFDGATTEQWCKDTKWARQCSGIGSCSFSINKPRNSKYNVVSSCPGSYAITLNQEPHTLRFTCAPTAPVKIEPIISDCEQLQKQNADLKAKITATQQEISNLQTQIASVR